MKASHRNTLESIPWMVTGRITESERRSLENHLNDCAECRAEYALQQKVHAAISNDTPQVDYAPGTSLQKLWARIGEPSVAEATPTKESATPKPARMRFVHWLAAAVVIEAIGITLMAVRNPAPTTTSIALPPYRTVTTTEIVPQTAVLRVVFAPDLSVRELNALLDQQELTVVSGPTKAGVYTLATTAPIQELPNSIPATLHALRSHPSVRLAEPIGPAALSIRTQDEKTP